METLILISGIIVTFSLLIAIQRLNTNLARFMATETKIYPVGQPFCFINVAGKWLTFIGGIATFPLVIALIFTPEASANWVSTLGVIGCLALIAAALLLIPTCILQCLKRKVNIKRIVLSSYHAISKKVLKVAGYKMLGLIAGLLLLALFVPFVADLLIFLVYIVGFLFAGRLGLLEIHENDDDDHYMTMMGGFYNYRTGKVEGYGGEASHAYYDED